MIFKLSGRDRVSGLSRCEKWKLWKLLKSFVKQNKKTVGTFLIENRFWKIENFWDRKILRSKNLLLKFNFFKFLIFQKKLNFNSKYFDLKNFVLEDFSKFQNRFSIKKFPTYFLFFYKTLQKFPKFPFFTSRKSENAIPAAQLENHMLSPWDCTHLRISRISASGFRRHPMYRSSWHFFDG